MKARKLSGRNLLNVRRKAKRGDAEAQFKLSEYYGFDKPRMYHKWLQLAAQQKHPAALYWLGREYEDGSIKSRDVARGEQLIRESAELGYARAQGIYGLMCIKRYGRTPPNYYEAVKWLRLSAAQGSRHAQYELGFLLETGHGFTTENP
ncbi:MAG: tetratricopeptide repeat protein, partial [Ignavibacteriae bacterium]|nr:tetratricopeptide repeat protein [Ignavibacteriota bacterium]